MPCAPTAELGRLRWRCRRGMRELDVLLTRYAEERYGDAPPGVQEAFRDLLEQPDPVIHGYLLGRVRPSSPLLASLIESIASSGAGGSCRPDGGC